MKKKDIGIAVIGSGRIGSLRAGMASRHPSVHFLALADKDKTKADILAQKTGANLVTNNNFDAISHEDVDAVIVATPEHDHVEAVLQAVKLGKPVFLEKPLALTLEDGNLIANAVKEAGVELVIGYSRRHDRRWMMTKQHIKEGRLGEVIAIQSRVMNTRAQMLEIIKRSPGASPVLDVLTYYVDLVCWYLEGIRPVEVVARSHGKVFRNLGHEVDEATWAIITFENGAIVNLGIFYALPATYPTFGQSPRFEIFGEDGVILLDADNKDSVLYSDKGIPHAYVPDHDPKMLFMQTNSSGDWALDDFWGPIANETRSWLDHLVTGLSCPHTTIEEGLKTLKITLAIEESARTGAAVKID
jgi:predicted dehydrogenase